MKKSTIIQGLATMTILQAFANEKQSAVATEPSTTVNTEDVATNSSIEQSEQKPSESNDQTPDSTTDSSQTTESNPETTIPGTTDTSQPENNTQEPTKPSETKPVEQPTTKPSESDNQGTTQSTKLAKVTPSQSVTIQSSTTGQNTQPKVQTQSTVQEESKAYHQAPSAPIQELVPESTLSSDGTIHFEKNESVEQFIQKIGEAARKVGQENDLYASVMIAQAILESASGQSLLSKAPNYNLFGIKGTYNGKGVSFATQEDLGNGTLYTTQATFRQYQSYEESLKDYAKLLKEGLAGNVSFYEGVWKSKAKTYQEATQYLTGRYATDSQYNQKLNGLIETYDLTMYDHPKATVEMTESDFPAYNGKNYDTSNSYAWGNCTQYVYNRITQLGKHIDLTMGNGKNWGATGQARGYEVSRTPQAGTAVSFPAGVLGADPVYGHVAFVEKVNQDGSIYISEMNVQGLNVVSTRTISANQTSMLSYIMPK